MSQKANPIIVAIGKHLVDGDIVTRVHFDSYSAPQQMTCILDDGSAHLHTLDCADFMEFQKFEKAAREWWNNFVWPESSN